MLAITKTPEKAIQGTGYTSNWVATDSPIEFCVQRKDNLIASTANNGGKVRITLSTNNAIFYLSEGEYISIHDNASGISFITTVQTKHSDTDYTLNMAYASQQFDFYVAYRKIVNYFFEVRLTVNGTEQDVTARFTPQLNGLAKCDISGYLQTYVSDDKVGTYSDDFTAETNQSGTFLFAVKENYIGNTNTAYVVNNITWYYVKAVRSIEKGTNMSEYVPNLEAQSKFLNSFDEPTYWLGLPFDISFVYSELLAGKSIQLIEKHYNSLNILLSTQTKVVDASTINKMVSASIKSESIEPTCDYITLSIVTDDAQPPVVVDTWYITASPLSPSRPWTFVKSGTNVTATVNREGVKKAFSPLPILDLPNVALIPASQKQATYTGSKSISELQQFYSQMRITAQTDSYTELSVAGKIKATVVTTHGDVGYYSAMEITVPNTVTTLSAFNALLGQLITACSDNINSQLGGGQISVNNSGTYIDIDASGGDAIAVYLSSSNRVDFKLESNASASSWTMTAPITVPVSQDLFTITTDGKVKNGWRIKEAGFVTGLLSDDYEFTYSLV